LTQSGPALTGSNAHGGFAHWQCLKIRSAIPHKALGLILYSSFEKIMEDFAGNKARKI